MKKDLQYIEQQKALYKSLRPCYCNAIQETVHFTSDGLAHLLYHRRRPRKIKERMYRAAMISYLVEVVTNATSATKTLDSKYGKDSVWALEHVVKSKHKGRAQRVKVIIIKKGGGSAHFLSAMCTS